MFLKDCFDFKCLITFWYLLGLDLICFASTADVLPPENIITYNLLFNNRNSFTAEAFQRKNKAYDYLVETFKLAMNSLKDGEQNLDLEDYGEEQNIERIIQDELAVEQSPLHDPEYQYLPPLAEDYIDDDEELAELYNFPYEREGLVINP